MTQIRFIRTATEGQDMGGFSRRELVQAGAAFAALAPASRAAMAQTAWPSRQIHLIVGFTPGTATDILARTLANGAEPLLGQKMIVENKPGAASALAAEYVARSG